MFTRALFIDFKEGEIPFEYQERLKKLSASQNIVSRDDANLSQLLADTEVIFAKIATKIDRELIETAPNLRYIGVLATAFDAIDVSYTREKNIAVSNLGGYSTEAVSELFFATLFEAVRDLEKAKQQARREDYSFGELMGQELAGKTLGVLGAGKIGSRIAKIGLGIGMKVLYFDKENKSEIDNLGAERRELDEVLSKSDFVSLNLLLNKETEGIVGKPKIAMLKRGCIFINLSPPSLIDQEAMMERAGKGDMTFIFDHVDDISPSLAKRFLATQNCIVYPPIGFRTVEANTARWETLTSNIEQFARGKSQNVVN